MRKLKGEKRVTDIGKKRIIRMLIALTVMVGVIILLTLIKRIEWVSENVFARGISRAYAYVVGHITSLLPFSIFEFSIYAAIVTAVIFIVIMIIYLIKKRWICLASTSLILSLIVISVILLYTVTASVNYYRAPLSVPSYSDEVDRKEYINIGEYFLADYNNLAESFQRDENNHIISPYTDIELAKLMREEFKRLQSPYINSFVPLAKPILFSEIMSYNSLMGISFAPTAEPNINADMPCYAKPFTMAHEIAHSLGIMREYEANLIASYITLTSDNDFIRYSGYFDTFGQVSSIVGFEMNIEAITDFYESYSPLISIDNEHYWEFFSGYSSFFDRISTFFNDLYLKFHGVEDGTDSYNDSYDYDTIDTGELDDWGLPIYDIVFSDVQKIYLMIYFDSLDVAS